MKNIDNTIVSTLSGAVRNSFCDLFENVNESFYYCTLVMQELSVPYISVMSNARNSLTYAVMQLIT